MAVASLQAGENLQDVGETTEHWKDDVIGQYDLITAVSLGDRDLVGEILTGNSCPDVNEKNENSWTPLMYAAFYGHYRIAADLLAAGASPDLTTNTGVTALMISASSGSGGVASLLLEAGASVNLSDCNGYTALFHALKYSLDTGCCLLGLLIDNGANPNVRDAKGLTPLMICVQRKLTHYMEFLIEKGADLKALTPEGYDIVSVASRSNQRDLIEGLTKRLAAAKNPSDPVCDFLHSLELVELHSFFQKEDIRDVETLVNMTDSDLKEIGVLHVGARRKILNAIGIIKHRQVTNQLTDIYAKNKRHSWLPGPEPTGPENAVLPDTLEQISRVMFSPRVPLPPTPIEQHFWARNPNFHASLPRQSLTGKDYYNQGHHPLEGYVDRQQALFEGKQTPAIRQQAPLQGNAVRQPSPLLGFAIRQQVPLEAPDLRQHVPLQRNPITQQESPINEIKDGVQKIKFGRYSAEEVSEMNRQLPFSKTWCKPSEEPTVTSAENTDPPAKQLQHLYNLSLQMRKSFVELGVRAYNARNKCPALSHGSGILGKFMDMDPESDLTLLRTTDLLVFLERVSSSLSEGLFQLTETFGKTSDSQD